MANASALHGKAEKVKPITVTLSTPSETVISRPPLYPPGAGLGRGVRRPLSPEIVYMRGRQPEAAYPGLLPVRPLPDDVLSPGAGGPAGLSGGKGPAGLPREPRQARKGAAVPWTCGARGVAGRRAWPGSTGGRARALTPVCPAPASI